MFVGVTEVLGECPLVVEEQAIFAAAGNVMQTGAHQPQEITSTDERVVFLLAQKLTIDQVVQGSGIEMTLRHPGDHLDIA